MKIQQKEIWKKIPNYNDYEISNLGNVKSLKKGKEKIILSHGCGKRNGKYRYKSIKLSKNGVPKRIRIHQLVAMAFLNHNINNNNNLVVDHINNNGFDNRLENLQIITKIKNQQKDKKPISGFTGVHKSSSTNGWRVRVTRNKKEITIGYYKKIQDAKKAYDNFINNENKTRIYE